MDRDLASLAELLRHRPALALTGAGISTASGIPDYRRPDGTRRHADPMTFERFRGSAAERQRYWARSHRGWARIAAARPNVAHRTLASLEQRGVVVGTVTQNVDGLHRAAGSRTVIDLHGRLDAVVCLDCGRRSPRRVLALALDAANPRAVRAATAELRPDGDVTLDDAEVARFRVVDCAQCDGPLKPDVVFFGEHVPRDRFERTWELLDAAGALLVLGSSLMVGSGYRIVTAARRRGLPIAIVNRGVTRGDRHADVKLDRELCALLPALADALGERTGRGVERPAVVDGA